MKIRTIDPSIYPDWNDFIKTNFDPDIFHSKEWCRVLKSTYNFTPHYFLALNDSQPAAIIPLMEIRSIIKGKRAVCLPFSDFCHPLRISDFDLELARKEIINFGYIKKWRYIEFRSFPFTKNIYPFELYYTHDIDLTLSVNKLWNNLKDNNRRNLKKARRLGLNVRFENSWQSLKEFYKLQVITRKRHGLPPQPFKFFANIYKTIISQDLGVIASVYYQEKMIAASIFLNFNGKVIFKYGASDHVYHQLRPNNLIMWESINWHRSKGYYVLNLGRSSPDDSGLLAYKRLWGARESIINYYRFSFAQNGYVKYSTNQFLKITRLMALLPKNFLVFLGKILYKYSG